MASRLGAGVFDSRQTMKPTLTVYLKTVLYTVVNSHIILARDDDTT